MYIGSTYLLLLIAIMFAWFGKSERAMIIFIINLIVAVALLFHHMTDTIGLSL